MSTSGCEDDRRGDRVWVVYGLLAVLVVAYLISELVRPDGETWPWLDNWGVAVFEIVASGLCILRGITARRARVVPLTLASG